MSTSPFGAPGFGFPGFDPAQFQSLMRPWLQAAAPAAPATPDPFAWWTQAAAPAPAAFDPTALAQQWMAQMQQLAAQFGGGAAQPADIARAWRSMLGDNPFAHVAAANAFMPSSFMPPGLAGAARGPFDTPAFGYTREHQERAQAFAKAGAEFQQAAQAFGSVVAEAGQDAFARFESLLAQRAEADKPVETARALFDLWIDAAEDAYADVALGDRFQQAFGDYVNAQMRLRAATQDEVERASAQWGIPGRSEVDAAHRKIAMLEREVARLRAAIDAMASETTQREEAPRAAKPRATKTPNRKPGKR